MSLLKSRFIEMFKNSETLRLDQIAEVTMGQSPDSSSYNSVGKGIPFYQGKTEFTDKYIGQPSTWCTSPTRIAKENDILMSVRAPVGNVNIATEECCIGRGLSSIRPQNGFNSEFIFEALEQKKEELENKATGSTFKAINKDIVLSIQIPNTSISIQKEYSNFVKQIDKSKFLLQQILEKLELLKKSRFIEMFGSVNFDNSKFTIIKLGDAAKVGSSHRVFTNEFVDKGVPFYRGTEISELSNGAKPSKPFYISLEHYKKISNDDTKPQIGDILMPSICDKGQLWLVDTNLPFYYKDGRVLCISPNKNLFVPAFLHYFLKIKTISEYKKIGSGSTFAEFKIFQLKNINVILPPKNQQEKFSEILKQIDKSKFNVFQDQTASQVKVIVVLHHIC